MELSHLYQKAVLVIAILPCCSSTLYTMHKYAAVCTRLLAASASNNNSSIRWASSNSSSKVNNNEVVQYNTEAQKYDAFKNEENKIEWHYFAGYLADTLSTKIFTQPPVFLYEENISTPFSEPFEGFIFTGQLESMFNSKAIDALEDGNFVVCSEPAYIKTGRGYEKSDIIIACTRNNGLCLQLLAQLKRDFIWHATRGELSSDHPETKTLVFEIDKETEKFVPRGDLSTLKKHKHLSSDPFLRNRCILCRTFEPNRKKIDAIVIPPRNDLYDQEVLRRAMASHACE